MESNQIANHDSTDVAATRKAGFRDAYFDRLTVRERKEAQRRFCYAFGHSPNTFCKLLSGHRKLTEKEYLWMEKYNPAA